MAETAKKATLFGFALLIALVALLHIAYYFPRTVDDLFIYLRYAQNLAGGHGLAYNPPERVEGFSSLPWVMLLSIGFRAGLEAITFTKALGILSFFLLLGGVYLLARRLTGGSRALALLACLLVSLSSCVVSWSILGLETPLFLAALFWTIHALLWYQEAPGAVRGAALAGASFILGISRPEAPLYLVFIFGPSLLLPRKGASFGGRLRTVLPVAGVVVVLLILFEAWRYSTFGAFVPHVYYAKKGSGLMLANLVPLFSRGASILDLVYVSFGLLMALVFLFGKPQAASLTGVVLCCLIYAALVDEDWMPNLRFFLPLIVCLALFWTTALAWCLRRMARWRPWFLAAAVIDAVLALAALQSARIESRFMTAEFFTHGDGKNWVRPKSLAAMKETMLCLRRQVPEDIERLPIDSLGMIHQVFDALEASSEPLEKSWYIGRDIGMLGYFTPIKVFDTDGLFTPALAGDAGWRNNKGVSRELLARGFSLRPVATELLDDWGPAAGRDKNIMKTYDVITGQPGVPKDIRPKGQTVPSPAQILRRYQKAYDIFPKLYFIQTLHGESAGAAMERRFRFIKVVIRDHASPLVTGIDKNLLAGGASFPQARILTHGCRIEPHKAVRGKEIVVRCYFETTGIPEGTYKLFMHFDGPVRFQGDHYPLGGLLPASLWPAGIIQDVFRMEVPPTAIPGSYRLYFGLYGWKERIKALPVESTDGNNRVAGPEIIIED